MITMLHPQHSYSLTLPWDAILYTTHFTVSCWNIRWIWDRIGGLWWRNVPRHTSSVQDIILAVNICLTNTETGHGSVCIFHLQQCKFLVYNVGQFMNCKQTEINHFHLILVIFSFTSSLFLWYMNACAFELQK